MSVFVLSSDVKCHLNGVQTRAWSENDILGSGRIDGMNHG